MLASSAALLPVRDSLASLQMKSCAMDLDFLDSKDDGMPPLSRSRRGSTSGACLDSCPDVIVQHIMQMCTFEDEIEADEKHQALLSLLACSRRLSKLADTPHVWRYQPCVEVHSIAPQLPRHPRILHHLPLRVKWTDPVPQVWYCPVQLSTTIGVDFRSCVDDLCRVFALLAESGREITELDAGSHERRLEVGVWREVLASPQLRHLRRLRLAISGARKEIAVDEECMELIAQMAKLETLEMVNGAHLEGMPAELLAPLTHAPSLTSIQLPACPGLQQDASRSTCDSLRTLSTCSELTRLHLHRPHLLGSCLFDLPHFGAKLHHLTLTGFDPRPRSGSAVDELGQSLGTLRALHTLRLEEVPHVATFLRVTHRLASLRHLVLSLRFPHKCLDFSALRPTHASIATLITRARRLERVTILDGWRGPEPDALATGLRDIFKHVRFVPSP